MSKYQCGQMNGTLVWVPGYRNIAGNWKEVELAREGHCRNLSAAENVRTPINTIKRNINLHFLEEAKSRWRTLTTCKFSNNSTWSEYRLWNTEELIGMPRQDVTRITSILTGHWLVGEHPVKWAIPYNTCCRSCQNEGEKVIITHVLCKCPALSQQRYKLLGYHIIHNLVEIVAKEVRELRNFFNSTRRVW